MKVQVQINIDMKRIADLLITAFEGGSNHWIQEWSPAMRHNPANNRAAIKQALQEVQDEHGIADPVLPYLLPLHPDGEVHIVTIDGDKVELYLKLLKHGLERMSVDVPHQFAEFMRENEDAITADVFLQCALFGEEVYG